VLAGGGFGAWKFVQKRRAVPRRLKLLLPRLRAGACDSTGNAAYALRHTGRTSRRGRLTNDSVLDLVNARWRNR